MKKKENINLPWVMCEKLLPTKDTGCFFTFLLMSRISLPLDVLPTSACNISECWVSLQEETHCSLNNAIACPLTGNRQYASADDCFFLPANWICMQLGLFHLRGVSVCVCAYVCTEPYVCICGDLSKNECCWKAFVWCFIVHASLSLSLQWSSKGLKNRYNLIFLELLINKENEIKSLCKHLSQNRNTDFLLIVIFAHL